jgi:preprotein translocase subunit YajC
MMGDFNRYVDLFKTYGIEYIIIIVFLIAIIFFWMYLSKRPKKKNGKG